MGSVGSANSTLVTAISDFRGGALAEQMQSVHTHKYAHEQPEHCPA